MSGWMDFNDPLDNTKVFNQTGLVCRLLGYLRLAPWDKFVFGVTVGQQFLMENTTLGIPAMFQSEGRHRSSYLARPKPFSCHHTIGLHGFTNKGTNWPSPIGLAASFNPAALLTQAAATIADEAEGLEFSQIFSPVLDLSRELRWGRVEDNFGEDPFL